MPTADAAFSGSIPELYDRYLGPLLFQPYADDLTERAKAAAPSRVLEIAAGTGIVTRTLARAMPEAELTATDLNPAMLEHAAKLASLPRVTYGQADAQALPFPEASFDAVVCQFGVMFFPDKPQAFAQARRVLRPGGCYLFNVWDRLEANALSHAVQLSLRERYPADPPEFLSRAPFGYFDAKLITAALVEAGFGDVGMATVPARSRCPSVREAVVGLCQGSPLRGELEAREPSGLDDVIAFVEARLARQFGLGPVDAPMQAHVLWAMRPR